jgi:hypothetical protein
MKDFQTLKKTNSDVKTKNHIVNKVQISYGNTLI